MPYTLVNVYSDETIARIKSVAKKAYTVPAGRDTAAAVAEFTELSSRSIRQNRTCFEKVYFSLCEEGRQYIYRGIALDKENGDVKILRTITTATGRSYITEVRLSRAKGKLRQEIILEILATIEYIAHVCKIGDEERRRELAVRRELDAAAERRNIQN